MTSQQIIRRKIISICLSIACWADKDTYCQICNFKYPAHNRKRYVLCGGGKWLYISSFKGVLHLLPQKASKLACFVLYLKNIDIFLRNNIYIL